MLLLTALIISAVPERGVASVDDGRPTRYDGANYHGRVSTGERFRPGELAIAHRTRRLGSTVIVQNERRPELLSLARVWDRGPCLSAFCQRTAPLRVRTRIADLTPALRRKIGCSDLCRVLIWGVN